MLGSVVSTGGGVGTLLAVGGASVGSQLTAGLGTTTTGVEVWVGVGVALDEVAGTGDIDTYGVGVIVTQASVSPPPPPLLPPLWWWVLPPPPPIVVLLVAPELLGWWCRLALLFGLCVACVVAVSATEVL